MRPPGALKGGAANPSQYQSAMRIFSRQESVILTYAPNGTVGIEAVPLTLSRVFRAWYGSPEGT